MPYPFDESFMRLALVAGLVVGACAPLIGAYLVERRLALIGDGIGHLAFAGVAAGVLLDVAPVWTALIVAVGGGLLLEMLRRRASSDLALALFFYAGLAGGVVLMGRAGSLNASVLQYLFGAILTVSPGDVVLIAALGAGVVATLAVCGRGLFAAVVDEEGSRASGVPVDALNLVLAVLTPVTVVLAMRAVGILLVAALMVLPVGAARTRARSFRATLGGAVLVGMGSVVAGLSLARIFSLAAGGTIVLVAAGAFALSSILPGRRAPA